MIGLITFIMKTLTVIKPGVVMYSLTVFGSIFDNKTDTRVDFDTFEQLEKSLYHLATLPGYKAKKGEYLKGKKISPLISPAIYKPNSTRANANVIEWAGWAAIDVDNHNFEGNLQDELRARFGMWDYVCYSTASSTVAQPKFRLVFPLTRSVNASEIKHFWYALNTEFECMGDKQTKDLSRMYYVPAKYPGAHNFIFSNRGAPIDPTALMQKHPWTAPSTSDSFIDRLPPELQKEVVLHRQQKLQEHKRQFDWSSYKDCPFVNQRLIKDYKAIARTDGSGRYSMIYKIMTSIACNAVKRQYPITEYEIVDLVRQLDRETSNIYAKRPLNAEASRAIEFAYKNI
jgi:hypothetical protein